MLKFGSSRFFFFQFSIYSNLLRNNFIMHLYQEEHFKLNKFFSCSGCSIRALRQHITLERNLNYIIFKVLNRFRYIRIKQALQTFPNLQGKQFTLYIIIYRYKSRQRFSFTKIFRYPESIPLQ